MPDDRLSRIGTLWSVVRRAHGDDGDAAQAAQQELLNRYGTAIRNYLLAGLRDQTAADEMYQEFSLRFVKGDYASADPDRGRFRNFLRTILVRLVIEHHRARGRDKFVPLEEGMLGQQHDGEQQRQEFTQIWREELLARVWKSLARQEQETGSPLFTALDARVEHPSLKSPQLAEEISQRLGKSVTPENTRVLLHRARAAFGKLLIDEVAQTLDEPDRDSIEQELTEIELLEYCRPVLDKRD